MKQIRTLIILMLFASVAFGQNAPINFEFPGQGADWTWTVFENFPNPPLEIIANPHPSGINTSATVAKFTAMQTGQPFAGVESAHGNSDLGPFVLDETNNVIKIMVWKSVISDVGIKLASSTGWSQGELKVPNTLINQWEELTFNFSGFINPPDPELGMLDQIIIFPDFAPRTQNNIIYFDNITFNSQGDATLSDLKVDGTTIAGFSPTVLNYSVILPEGATQVPVVTATANDPQASLVITPATSLPGTTQVAVTSANGNATQIYSVGFLIEGDVPLSDYCETQVWHLGNPAETASTIFLTIANAGTNSMIVEIESANADPVDFLLVIGGSGAMISDENTTIPGKISRTLTWAGTPPAEVELNVLWSKVSFPGNWQLSPEDITVSFEAICTFDEPTPRNPIDFEPGGYGADWTWTVFENFPNPPLEIIANPDPSGINTSATVAKFTAMQTGQPFAGVESSHGNNDLGPFVLDETNNVIKIMVWKPVISDVGIKLASSTGWSEGELKVANTLVNQWEELTFDFSDFNNPPDPELGMLDQIIILPDFDLSGRTQDNIIYFDNITFNPQGDATLSDLKVDGATINGFSPSIFNYSLTLPEGTTEVPAVTATANDPEAGVEINPAQSLPGITTVVVTSADGNNSKTYSVSFAVEGEAPLSDYCETQVWHLGNPAETASTIFLTIANAGTNSMIVEIESANADPVDFLLVAGGSGAMISDENTTIPGKISRTLTWAGTPPAEVELNVLWSKESFAGNWQLSPADITVPFEAVCGTVEPKPYLELDIQDNFEDDGYATVDNWKFQDGAALQDLTIVEDPVNPSNNVAFYNRSGKFLYTNAQVILDHRMDLTKRNEFRIKVFFPSTNNYSGALTQTAALKLQNSMLGGNAWTTQAEVVKPVNVLDSWVTLIFDFSAAADSVNYDQIIVQLGGENHPELGVFYFDDFELLQSGPRVDFSAEPLSGTAPLTVQFTAEANFAATTWQWDFDNNGTIDATVKNPVHTYTAPGVYSVKLFASNPFLGNAVEIKENYITVEPAAFQQTVNIPAGWSGISSYVVPANADIENLFDPLESLIILYGSDGIYHPAQSINTLENWDSSQGYVIKMAADEPILFQGMTMADRTIALSPGWSIVPVISECPVNVESLLDGFDQIIMVKEVAGLGVFWPDNDINTLETLLPGKAYYFFTSASATFTFPVCDP